MVYTKVRIIFEPLNWILNSIASNVIFSPDFSWLFSTSLIVALVWANIGWNNALAQLISAQRSLDVLNSMQMQTNFYLGANISPLAITKIDRVILSNDCYFGTGFAVEPCA